MSFRLRRVVQSAAVAALCVCAGAPAASAQEPLAAAPEAVEFLPRFDLKLIAAGLGHQDQRFSWDTHWVGDFDLLNYKRGRATFLADYQALLGREFRPFDPYQSNYLLEASGSFFAGNTEVAAVLNHVSRHLGDRPKRNAIAENSLGIRVMRRFSATGTGTSLDVRADARKIIQRSYVDYTWMTDLDLWVRQRVHPHAAIYGRAYGELIPVDRTIAGRSAQRGGRVEAGVRLEGTDGALELFGGYEQMIDADPLDRLPRRWAFWGFRLRAH
ncbi:MAG: hypothetical protein AB7Q29_06540 [Vicinamibacterales bacterium]